MDIKAAEISAILKDQIKNFGQEAEVSEVGQVLSVGDGIARVAGETAPIMFTAAYVVRDNLPWQGLEHWYDIFFQGVMALPYHIYVVSSKIPQNEYTERVQYGTAFVFLLIVATIALSSVLLRNKLRKSYRW